jgi:hypothetical protein
MRRCFVQLEHNTNHDTNFMLSQIMSSKLCCNLWLAQITIQIMIMKKFRIEQANKEFLPV